MAEVAHYQRPHWRLGQQQAPGDGVRGLRMQPRISRMLWHATFAIAALYGMTSCKGLVLLRALVTI